MASPPRHSGRANSILMLFFFICASLSWLSPAWCSGIYPDEPEYSYEDGPTGPENWGNLKPEWSACRIGESQSPIPIYKKDHDIVKADLTLIFNYTYGDANLHLGTHDVGVEWTEDAGGVYWEGEEYKLLQFHTHSPSEHTVKNERFPLEIHLVHEGPNGKLLVVALLFKYGKENSLLDEIVHVLPGMINTGKQDHQLENFSVKDVKIGDMYYHYTGSLTTPPCTEGVIWIVMKKKHSVSKEQVAVISNAQQGDNARPLQALNGRIVYKNK